MVFSYAARFSFTISHMISDSDYSSSFISFSEVAGVSCAEAFLVHRAVFGVDSDLVDYYFEFIMVTNVLNT